MSTQTNRLFEIVYTLLNKKTVQARDLAQQFGVSTRTIYRDIDTLSLAGIPVYTVAGKGGGISLLPDFVMSSSMLNEQEQQDVLLAVQGLTAVKAIETDQVLLKLSGIFNKHVPTWLNVDFSDWSYRGEEIFQNIKYAIVESKILQFDYFGAQGDRTSRKVEPIQLWFKSRAWYIKGFCHMRQDIRLFKLNRIRNFVLTDESFPKRDLQNIIPSGSQREYNCTDIQIRLKIAPEMTYRVYDEFDTVEPQPDGSNIVTIMSAEDDWLYGFILTFGEYAEVLEPAHLRDSMAEKIRRMLGRYM